jgi:hypothetical protein
VTEPCVRCGRSPATIEPPHAVCQSCVAELNSPDFPASRGWPAWVSVSAIADRGDEKSGLVSWGYRMGASGRDVEEIREKSKERGNLAHEALGVLIEGGQVNWSDYGIATSYVRSLVRWWERKRPLMGRSETNVFSERHGYRGRIDGFWFHDERCPECRGESGEPVDMKLGTGPGHVPSHAQLALYRIAWNEMGLRPRTCGPGKLLHVDWRGPVEPESCVYAEDPEIALGFLAALRARLEGLRRGAGGW